MKLQKVVFGLALFGLLGFVNAGKVLANEGVVQLAGKAGTSGRCFAASVYVDGGYRVLVTCRDLKMAVDPVKNKYVVWVQIGETYQRLGEIVSGKLQSGTDEKFEKLFVTLEEDSYPIEPSGEVVLAGQVEAIDFGKGVVDTSTIKVTTTTPTTTPAAKVTEKIDDRGAIIPTVKPTPGTNKLVAVVSGIGKAVLIGFILLLIVVGAMGFLARRKSL